jgi:uncharacterized protein (TIGR03083 family)
MPPTARRADPVRIRPALSAQWQALRSYVAGLEPSRLAAPSSLPAWTVNELIAHIADGIAAVTERLDRPAPARAEVTITDWARGCEPKAPGLAADARELAATVDPRELLDREVGAAEAALDRVTDPQRTVWSMTGGFRLGDYLITRVVEAVVHGDDLDRDFPHNRAALGICVRALADVLATTVPGSSVELRIPPFAAVQCVPGPRHTRGTPPGVVELDPLTWVRLATGRAQWADAVAAGRLRASGERTDLTRFLPILV